GLKVQHALRAFTAADRKAIKQAAENYPLTDFYDIDQLITELGIGEAFVTTLNEKGIPTPLVQVMLRPPASRMDVLTNEEIDRIVSRSEKVGYYNEKINRESAYEILTAILNEAGDEDQRNKMQKQRQRERPEKSTMEKIMDSTVTRQVGRTVARELTRGLLGVLGVRTTARKKAKSTGFKWF
ncbi:MAG: helicase HerA-like domain-containing protein, partial [Saprospiraceae bacterium]